MPGHRKREPDTRLLGRAGAAVGDSGSLLAGLGIDYELERDMSVRQGGARNGAPSLQFNVVYYPGPR